MSETSSRLLELLSLLQGRRDCPGNELADRLEVSDRTIRRDIGRLRRLGYPVESLTGPAGGYQLRAGSAMPSLLLDDEEAIAIAVGLHRRRWLRDRHRGNRRASPRQARAGAAGAPAPPRRRAELGSGHGPSPPARRSTRSTVSVIAAACRDSECLRFGYRSRDGTDSRREVEPCASTMVAAGIWSPGIVAARTGAHSASTAWLNQRRPAGVSSRAGCRRKMRPRRSSKALPGRQTDSRRWSRCTPPRRTSPAAYRATGARSSR